MFWGRNDNKTEKKRKQPFFEESFGDMMAGWIQNAREERMRMHPLTLEAFADDYSDFLDEQIDLAEKRQNLHYVGGQFIMESADDTHFSISIDLYFQNAQKEWVRMQTPEKTMDLRFLNEPARKELQEKGKVIFEVNAPEHKSKDDSQKAEKKP